MKNFPLDFREAKEIIRSKANQDMAEADTEITEKELVSNTQPGQINQDNMEFYILFYEYNYMELPRGRS